MNVTTAAPNPTLPLLERKIAFSTLVQYAGKVAQLVIATITLKLISGFLSEHDYGLYASITEYALFFSVVANLGIFGNLVRVMADAPKDGKVFTQALMLRLLTAGFFFVVAILWLLVTGGESAFLTGTILFLAALLFDYVTSICDAMLQANYLMGRATVALVAGRVVNLVLLFVVLKFIKIDAANLTSMLLILACTVVGSLLTAGISLWLVRKKIRFEWAFDRLLMRKILLMSLPFGIINIFNNLYFRFLPDYFAHNTLTVEQFGSFSINFRISQVLSLASTFLMFSVLPGLKEYIDAKHWQKAHTLSKRITVLLSVAGVLLVVVGSLAGSQIIELLTHKKYLLQEFGFMFPMMLLLAAISYGYDLVLITLFAFDEDIWFLKREAIALILAFGFFCGSLLVPNKPTRLFLILAGAVVGESFMVISGYLRMRKCFQKRLTGGM